jgi:flagellar hook protein FlgE
MTVYFRRTDDGDEGLSWDWHAVVDRAELASQPETKTGQIGQGVVRFDANGALKTEETIDFAATFANGAKANQVINIDFGQNVSIEEGNGVGASSATGAKSATNFHSQNGYSSGNLKSLKIEIDGKVNGFYTNGIQRTLGAISLATFENTDGLQKAGRNQFFKTLDSGPPRIGLANSGTRGSIFSSSLEESNVDLAGQFVNMIQTQRGFQANSRSVTTTDTMLEEVVNLKR